MSPSAEEYRSAFKEAGGRITRQREKIFDFLSRAGRRGVHPSARQVHESLARSGESISVATVYNTMGALVRLGLVKVIEFESGDNRYETNLHPHVNLVCSSCGAIEDLQVQSSIHVECAMKERGFLVRDYRLEYYGDCARCAGRGTG